MRWDSADAPRQVGGAGYWTLVKWLNVPGETTVGDRLQFELLQQVCVLHTDWLIIWQSQQECVGFFCLFPCLSP